VPTLILHGDDNQIVPIGASAMPPSKITENATLQIYEGAPHGMCPMLKEPVNPICLPSCVTVVANAASVTQELFSLM
jgi:hypothetical protein